MLFHGSSKANLKYLKPISKCNENEFNKVVYLTENKYYSLFYIWDEIKTKRKIKWVTCWLKNGIVYYEEQFPNQLKKFYKKASGYVYSPEHTSDIIKANEPQMWYSISPVNISKVEYVKDVYKKIIEAEKSGCVVIHRYNKLSKTEKYQIDKKMCDFILSKNYLKIKNEDSIFMQKHHRSAWHMAKKMSKTKNV